MTVCWHKKVYQDFMPYTLNTLRKDSTDIIMFKSLMYKWDGSRPWDILGTRPTSGISNSSLVICVLSQWLYFDISPLNDSSNSMKMFQNCLLLMICQHNILLCLFVWDKCSLFCLGCLWSYISSASASKCWVYRFVPPCLALRYYYLVSDEGHCLSLCFLNT